MRRKLRMICITISCLLSVFIISGCQSSEHKRAEEAKRAADYFDQEYQKAKDDYDNLQSDLNRYNELQRRIKEATPGTSEYEQLVSENNAIVRKLIEKYPEIADEVTVK